MICIGAIVTPGLRRTPNQHPAIGVVVDMTPRSRPHTRTEEMGAKVRFLSSTGKVFTSIWAAEDLLVVEEATLGEEILEQLDGIYLAYMMDTKAASDFIPS